MAPSMQTLPPPTIGTSGFRVLDDLRFACEVVDFSDESQTLSVRYLDDATIENDVELVEFEPEIPIPKEGTTVSQQSAAKDDTLLQLIPSSGSPAQCLLYLVAPFLEPYEWLATLVRISHHCRRLILSASLWHTLRIRSCTHLLPRLLDIQLATAAVGVGEVLAGIVLDDSDVTDDQVLSLAMNCPQLQSISLQCCHRLSFMVVYELFRLCRERHAAGETPLQSVDLWLCRGISPTFVSQLITPPRPRPHKSHHDIDIQGPGFFFLDVSRDVLASLDSMSIENEPQWPTEPPLEIMWVQETMLLETIDQVGDDPHWQSIKRHAPLLKTASLAGVVPLVHFNQRIENSSVVCLGVPSSTLHDLTRLIQQSETNPTTRSQLFTYLRTLAEKDDSLKTAMEPIDPVKDDPLTAQAARVFAVLRETTEQLQAQVDRLEHQVAAMTRAKILAENEYKHAQRELQRVAQEADRAVLSLATSTNPGVDQPPQNGRIQILPDDELLPPLPSRETIVALAETLEDQSFAILDGFVGEVLASAVQQDVEKMYLAPRALETQLPDASASSAVAPPPPVPTSTRFTRGELAGGITGRNLRYQLTHVRGDYMLWLDEHDAFCPESIRRLLRQLDRVILERLSVVNHELSMSALLRKKAMVTCYPGKHKAQYTRHCDNPNRNGRKLTAILYLNRDWDVALQGGELVLHPHISAIRTVVAPVLDRLVLFFSDQRIPHQVLPCRDATRDRFALTVWYLDYDEYMHAQVFGTGNKQEEAVERRRIEQEIERLMRASNSDAGDAAA